MKNLIILPLLLLSLSAYAGGESGGGGGPAITMLKKIETDIINKAILGHKTSIRALNVDISKGFSQLPLVEVDNIVTSEGFLDIRELLNSSEKEVPKNAIIEIPNDSEKVKSIQLMDGSIFFLD